MEDPAVAEAKLVTINVGGKIFATAPSTLTKMPHASMIGAMFSGEFTVAKDVNGHVFIDNDGSAFHIVLNYLRHGKLVVTDAELAHIHAQLQLDAEYYCLPELQSAVEKRLTVLKLKESARENELDVLKQSASDYMKQLKQMHKQLIEAMTELKGDDAFNELKEAIGRLTRSIRNM